MPSLQAQAALIDEATKALEARLRVVIFLPGQRFEIVDLDYVGDEEETLIACTSADGDDILIDYSQILAVSTIKPTGPVAVA